MNPHTQPRAAVSPQSAAFPTLIYWTASLMLIGLFLVADVSVVFWSAGLVGARTIVGASLTYAFVAGGLMLTLHKMNKQR
jgi:hypothetical protein